MDWTTHDPVVEPVMETVSQHGVYETYDRSRTPSPSAAENPCSSNSGSAMHLRATVHVAAHSPIQKIEIVRDGRYLYTRPGQKQMEVGFDFTDSERGKYYYVRVWVEGDKYAWTSPVFVD